jgi:REP element-mobilizing transposase RayT
MRDKGYKIRDQEGIYFISFAVVGWVDVFTRKKYCEILVESLKYCQSKKGLIIYAWCLMSNHIHLIVQARYGDLSNIIRDFKKFTSAEIIKAILTNPVESRKDWMLKIFSEAGRQNCRNKNYQFWRQDNQPKVLFGEKFIDQKLNYIHNNPLVAGIVDKAEEYTCSSARDYYYGKPCGLLEVDFLT